MRRKSKAVQMIRQGDVLLIRREPPASSTRVESEGLRVPGERTGHAHVLPAEVHDVGLGRRLLRLEVPTPITHEEHAPIEVPAGWWEPILQREWTPSSSPTRRAQFD